MNATNKRPLKVFLCHAHADRDPVRGLYTRLTQDGVDAWLDKEKLLPGQDWALEICRTVRASDVVIVCLSKQFNQAGYRQKEVRIALDEADKQPEGEIFIIPARLEECDVPERLSRWQWVNLYEDDGYEKIMSSLRLRAQKIGTKFQVSKHSLPALTSSSVAKSKKDISIQTLSRENGQYASINVHNNNTKRSVYCTIFPRGIFWLNDDPEEKPSQWIDITNKINAEKLPFSWHLRSDSPEEEIMPDRDRTANLAKFESSGDLAGRTTFTFYGREPSHWSGKFRMQIDILYRANKTALFLKKSITVCMDIVESIKDGVVYKLEIWECENEINSEFSVV